MMRSLATPQETAPTQAQLLDFLRDTHTDPLGFALGAYPWGQGVLSGCAGPDTWQVAVMEQIRRYLELGEGSGRIAVASGHGVGKSALCAMLGQWFLATHPHPQIIVTANTFTQLSSKTWREWAKWLHMSRLAPYFTWTATKCYHTQYPATWYALAQPWSESNPVAFAGTHDKSVLFIQDEASTIPDIIWETIEGAQTTEHMLWLAFGNPTQTTGRFRACFPGGQFAHRWQTYHVDARTARYATNKRQLQEWIDDYGLDSDFVKVRVLGEFPTRAIGMLITDADWQAARARTLIPDHGAPILLGVDVARYGDDRSTLVARRGPELLLVQAVRHYDNPRLASLVVETADRLKATHEQQVTIFVDGSNLGAVADLVRLSGWREHVMEVLANETPTEPQKYYNKMVECWALLRDWLQTRAALPVDDADLKADLLAPQYMYDVRTSKLRLEDKASLKSRTGLSPDLGDALAMTFARPVARVDVPVALQSLPLAPRPGGRLAWMGA